MPTKSQVIAQLTARCVKGSAIALEYVGEEKYNPNAVDPNGQPSQTDLGSVVKKYRLLGLFPQSKVTARAPKWVNFWVQDEGGPNEDAYVEPDSIEGIFLGQVQSYLDGIAQIFHYEVDTYSMDTKAAIVKVAVSDGAAGIKISRFFLQQDNQGNFSYKEVTAGSWNGI